MTPSSAKIPCDDCKDVAHLEDIVNLEIKHIIEKQENFFNQKEKNEKWRAALLAIVFGPLLAWNGWIQVQTKREVVNLSSNIVDYIEWKADAKAFHKEIERELERKFEALRDAINECRAVHNLHKFD